MSTTPTGAFLPPLSNRSSPLSSRRNSADEKLQRKSNSRSGSSDGTVVSARRMHVVTAGEQLLQAKRAEEERKEREMEALTYTATAHFPSPPPSKLTTNSRIAVPLPRDLLPTKRTSQPRRPPLPAAAASDTAAAATSAFDLESTWGRDTASLFVDGAMARATFQALLRDSDDDSRRRQEEEKQTSSQPQSRTHNTYAPPPAKSTFLSTAVPSSSTQLSASPPASDSGLLSALTQRVHTLETLTQQQSKQLAAKEQQLLQMQVERDTLLAISRSTNTASTTSAPASITSSELQQLRSDYDRLGHQVREMEQFLSDYGLQWIGDNADTSSATITASTSSSSSSSSLASPSTLPFHLPTLLQRVEQLNASLPPTSLHITHQSSVTRFQPPPYLLLTLYRDGLTLTQSKHREQPLQPYTSHSAHSLLADVMDGFFPSEWRQQWPDGVRVVVVDCGGDKCEDVARRRRRERRQRSWHAFEGAGRRVRETDDGRRQQQADEEAERVKREEGRERQAKAKEAFLNRLPTKVVSAAGQLVEVKAVVQRMVDGDSRDGPASVWQRVEVKESDTLTLLRSKTGKTMQPPFDPALNVCTLHVRVQHSSASDALEAAESSSFFMVMQSHHTLAEVFALLQQHVLSSSVELRSRKWRLYWASLQPRVVVEMEELGAGAASDQISYGRVDEKRTLAGVGWRQNCSLFVHVRSL